GRAEGCTIKLTSIAISREHVLVRYSPDSGASIQDLHSTFGTHVNGHRVQAGVFVPLVTGSRVQLAQDVFLTLERDIAIEADGDKGNETLAATSEPGTEVQVFPFFLNRNVNLVRDTFAQLRDKIPPTARDDLQATETVISSRIRELSAILEVSFALGSIRSFQRLLEYTIDMALQVTGAERGGLILFNENTQRFESAVVRRMGLQDVEKDMQTSESLIQKCFLTGETLVIRDTSVDPLVAGNTSIVINKILSIAVTPLRIQNNVIGVLYLDNRLSANTFTERVQELLRVFATMASQAIYNSRLLHQATTDSLTGLYNKKHFLQRLSEECARARRHRTDLSLLMLDIDHFKSFNDTHGHVIGDKVLLLVSRSLRDNVRVHDVCARYGGEEFAVILPQTPVEGAASLAEKLRKSIEQLPLRFGDKKLTITISVGVAGFDSLIMEKPATFVQYADESLYKAKHSGRNQVQVFSGS
ncbi:MAG TPA: diguanylate cyclase, partial [Candidatus Ozemobacteraceae bacterium]|nr:diguanylate cyclase [Candidatus Ozemobacteraceae bacterium]